MLGMITGHIALKFVSDIFSVQITVMKFSEIEIKASEIVDMENGKTLS